jgi:hypothetical protein
MGSQGPCLPWHCRMAGEASLPCSCLCWCERCLQPACITRPLVQTGQQGASHMPPPLKWPPLPLPSVLTVFCPAAAFRYAFYYYFAQVRLLGEQLWSGVAEGVQWNLAGHRNAAGR